MSKTSQREGQSKRHSLLEAFINVAIGGFFTVVSIVRSYALRRLFNWWGSL